MHLQEVWVGFKVNLGFDPLRPLMLHLQEVWVGFKVNLGFNPLRW